MKKTLLALTVGIIGSSALASDDFKMFNDKKLSQEFNARTSAVVDTAVVSKKTYIYSNEPNRTQATHLNQLPITSTKITVVETPVAEEPNLAQHWLKTSIDKTQAKIKSWTSDIQAKRNKEVVIYKNRSIYNSLDLTSTVPAPNSNDKLFFDTVASIDSIQSAKFKSVEDQNQSKIKRLNYTIYELAQKGNVNAIDYLCLNPKKDPYIQVSTMKYFCDLGSINNHTELLGYRAWEKDKAEVQVSNYYTDRRQQDYIAQKALNSGASWASILEVERIPTESTINQVHQALHNKQSYHWLHYDALDKFHEEYISH